MPVAPNTNRWIQSGWGHRVATVDELTLAIGRIGTLEVGRRFVWRGVANAKWPLRSSLYRTLVNEDPTRATPFSELEVRNRERALLREARRWGLGVGPSGLVSDLELLATFQHHGVPTRLLDVTTNPMTALYFACEQIPSTESESGALFAFDVTGLRDYPTLQAPDGSWSSMGDAQGWPLRQALTASQAHDEPFLVSPSLPDARMRAQEGLFLTGAAPAASPVVGVDGLPLTATPKPTPEQLTAIFVNSSRAAGRPRRLPFVVLLVPPALKRKMLPHLESTYNRSDRVLFPDVPGMVNALRKPGFDLSDPEPEVEL